MAKLTVSIACAAVRQGRLLDDPHNNATIDKTTKGASALFNKFRLQACKHVGVLPYNKDAETTKEWEQRANDAFASLSKTRLESAQKKIKIVSDKIAAREADDTLDGPTVEQFLIADLETSILTMRRMVDENTFKAIRTKSSSSDVLSIDMEAVFGD